MQWRSCETWIKTSVILADTHIRMYVYMVIYNIYIYISMKQQFTNPCQPEMFGEFCMFWDDDHQTAWYLSILDIMISLDLVGSILIFSLEISPRYIPVWMFFPVSRERISLSPILAHLGDKMIFKPIANGCVAVCEPPHGNSSDIPIINPGCSCFSNYVDCQLNQLS